MPATIRPKATGKKTFESNVVEEEGGAPKVVKRIALLEKGELKNPDIAWPTVLLFAAASFLWALVALAGFQNHLSPLVTIPLQSFLTFILFTPLHDASHSSIGRGKFKFINEIIGRVYGFIVCAPFPAFRWIHLQHHKHTNTHEDPDNWSKGGKWPRFFLPFFWVTQDLHYYAHYIPIALFQRKRPMMELLESLATIVGMYGLAYHLSSLGYTRQVFLFWLIPVRISTMCLAWLFDYVPHRPHKVSGKDDPYGSTAKIDGVFFPKDLDLTMSLLYQNFHNIHHLYPTVPFYMYSSIWEKYSDKLIELGTPVNRVFSNDPWFVR